VGAKWRRLLVNTVSPCAPAVAAIMRSFHSTTAGRVASASRAIASATAASTGQDAVAEVGLHRAA
jgi:hypothetical protein